MAFTAKSGKKYTNRSDMARDDRRGSEPMTTQRSKAAETEPEEPDNMDDNDGAPELMEDNMESPSGAEMHDQHGPAHKVVIQHDEASGMHMVQTDHPDGHSMMTQHGSVEAAHKYGKECAGC